MKRSYAWVLCLIAAGNAPSEERSVVRIGSKAFTESVILGEVARQVIESADISAEQRELGGTKVVWEALLAGQIDIYPEYTGTLVKEILAQEHVASDKDLAVALERRGIGMTAPLGFENTYVLGMERRRADELNIRRISDLASHPELRLGFSNEFSERDDGWPALKRHYRLPHQNVRGLDHDLAYRALASGEIDVTDFYSTDGKLSRYDFVKLADDARFFPGYLAVFLYRQDLSERHPEALAALRRLEGSLSEETMIALSARVDLESIPEAVAAATFLKDSMGIDRPEIRIRWYETLWENTRAHLGLVFASLTLGILVAVPLGIASSKLPRLGQVILAAVGLVQTVPSIVLLVLLIPLLGIGDRPAIFALFVYSLLPIVRTTHAGLNGIPASIRESAQAVGLTAWPRLWRIELPLASPSILAGVKTAAVINVGTATLGGFIGAGGFGQPIFQGLRRDDWTSMVWQGALPAALLSLAVLGIFELLERICVPKGLRPLKQQA